MDFDFTNEEIRVLGVLIEKELTTPDYYPLTLNSLTTGCNQKSNRHPVVAYSQSDVMSGLDALVRRRLVGHAAGAGSRSEKFRHATPVALDIDTAATAVLAELMLRGPQTVGELRARCSRMHPFESLDEVQAVLTGLAGRDAPLVSELGLRPGKKEPRWAHLLQGPVEEDMEEAAAAPRVSSTAEQIAALNSRVEQLEAAFEAFRKQFE